MCIFSVLDKNFCFYSWGGAPNPPYFFHCKKDPAGRTLQAAPCGPPCKKLAPRAAVRRTNLFLSGHFTTPYGRTSKMPLYSVKNKFYRRLQRGALNGNNTAQKRTTTTKARRETALCFMPFVLVQERVFVA